MIVWIEGDEAYTQFVKKQKLVASSLGCARRSFVLRYVGPWLMMYHHEMRSP
jgi:TnpA family transposase